MIFERQYSKILTRQLLYYLLEGRLPNIAEISGRLEKLFNNKSSALFQYIPQVKKEKFQNNLFNKQLADIHFDIETIQEELFDLFASSLRRLNYADLFHKANSYQLSKLESMLQAILFTFENADFYFLSAFDNFNDYSKTNRTESTDNIIDLKETCLSLPYGSQGNKRIQSSHLIDLKTWPVNVIFPISEYINTSKQVNYTNFGNIFIDTISSWMYEVVTTEPLGAKISFKFPLAAPAAEETEVLVNRFELSPAVSNQKAIITISTDDINYKKLTGYESGVFMPDQKSIYGIDIITELVQYVNIVLEKTEYDEKITGKNENKYYVYRFGLKGFGAHSVGRISNARYQSKPFKFLENEEQISKVSISADLETPSDTEINFSVALANGDNIISSFIPIKPTNGTAKDGANEVVNFTTTQKHSLSFDSSSNQFSSYATFRGHEYFKLNKSLPHSPIYGTASLLRGYKVWSRQKDASITTSTVSDNYVSFSKSDIEKMYTVTTEIPVFRNETVGSRSVVKLNTSKDVYYISGKHDLKPKANEQKTNSDAAPTYAVYEVLHGTDKPNKTFTVSATANKVKLPYDSFIIRGPNAPVVKNNTGSIIYADGKDYTFETEEIEGSLKSTGYIIFIETSQGGQIDTSSTPQISISLQLDPDVTYKVSSIVGKEVTLNNMVAKVGDTFKIKYRYVPTSPNDILKASVRVKDNLSSSKKVTYYTEGIDYIIDTSSGGIQRLPNGKIPADGSVFIDYRYKNANENIETFLTWAYVSESSGIQIKFDTDQQTNKNLLVADKEVGERFYISSVDGLVDITDSISTPIIGPGWVQFIVRSKNPDANIAYNGRGNLIDQIIQMRDQDKKRIFIENGKYFKEIMAFRDPLIQTSLNALKVNTLPKNHEFFAIDYITNPSDPVLVLNYNPGSTEELYLKVPQPDSSTEVVPASANEIFKLTWESKLEGGSLGNSLVVRCDLNRNSGTDGGVTPKVFSYYIRTSGS